MVFLMDKSIISLNPLKRVKFFSIEVEKTASRLFTIGPLPSNGASLFQYKKPTNY